jgi:hypothetical protein
VLAVFDELLVGHCVVASRHEVQHGHETSLRSAPSARERLACLADTRNSSGRTLVHKPPANRRF